jgi:hypothetical protein
MAQTTIYEIKRKIRTAPGAWRDLQRITKSGVERDALLSMLTMAVMPIPGKSDASRMRKAQRQLRSLAKQLRTVASHAERLGLDPYTHLELLSPFADLAFERFKEQEPRRRAPVGLFRAMRGYADWTEEQARKFGRCLRKNSQKEGDLGVMFLLFQVHSQTGELFAAALARLLTEASQAVGRPREFTADQLTKMFERHVLPKSPSLHPDNSTP